MCPQSLKAIALLRGLNQSDLARMAGVSRQAVSLWFKDEKSANIGSQTLQALIHALGVKAQDLLYPLPVLKDSSSRLQLQSSLLWDRFYPDLESFFVALVQEQDVALARLVGVFGMFGARSVLGEVVWRKFPHYQRYLPPIRRAECERIWKIANDLN